MNNAIMYDYQSDGLSTQQETEGNGSKDKSNQFEAKFE
jgi:hypothetical protein